MRWMVVAAAICGGACTEQMVEEMKVVVVDGAEIPVSKREPCSFYEWLETRWWREQLPYVAPMAPGTHAVVQGAIVPLRGQSELLEDGNTLVWTPVELHLQDESVLVGAIGRRPLDEAWCEFAESLELLVDQ